jgi:hypothetical protein
MTVIKLSDTTDIKSISKILAEVRIYADTYSSLNTDFSNRPLGSEAEVAITDPGTHIDVVSGDIVTNSGIYKKVEAGYAWISGLGSGIPGKDGKDGKDGEDGRDGNSGTGGIGDPLLPIRSKINDNSYNNIRVSQGKVSVIKKDLVIASIFNSYGVAQNGSFASSPGEIARQEWQAAFPWLNVWHDNYAIPGSWIANYAAEQVDGQSSEQTGAKLGIIPAHARAMAEGGDGRRRIPDIVLLGPPTNDSLPNIFNSLQSPRTFDSISYNLIKRFITEFGALVIGYNNPMIPCKRALLAQGDIPRFSLGPEFLMTYPASGLFLVDTYQFLVYDVATQTITCAIEGIFRPGLFDGNFMTIDGTCWIYVDEQHKLMRIVGISADFTQLTVDDGHGNPVITENLTTNRGFHMANFDNASQVIPIRNNDDLSRPATAPIGAPLAIEKRPFGANGELINVSTRLTTLNQIFEKNLISNGALLCDWVGEQKKMTTSDADIDTQFGTDAIHPADPLYQATRAPMRRIVDQVAYGMKDK